MSDLVERINEIDALLAYDGSDNASDDNGYQAFVKMRKIWPQLRVLPEQLDKAKDALRRIATDSYTKSDEEARWDQPLMIWQSVARGTLEFELSDDQGGK